MEHYYQVDCSKEVKKCGKRMSEEVEKKRKEKKTDQMWDVK